MMEMFAAWTVNEKKKMGTSLMTTIDESSWLKANFYLTKPKYLIATSKRTYYTRLNKLNTCLGVIHGLLYDLEFSKFLLKHDILSFSSDFFCETSELKNAFYAYVLIKAYASNKGQFDVTYGFTIFEKLTDALIDILSILPLDKNIKWTIYNSLFENLDHTHLNIDEVLKYFVDQIDHPILASIYMDFLFSKLDFAKDRDGRWNEKAISYFKTRPDVDLCFYSHMQHMTRYPNTGNGLIITKDMIVDFNKQNEQKTIVVNEFLSKIGREHETEYFENEPHSKLFLIPHEMGKIQFLMMKHEGLIDQYDEIVIFDDQPGALFKWLPIPFCEGRKYKQLIERNFKLLIPKLTINISPSQYGLGFLASQTERLDDAPEDIRKFLSIILRSIVYREDLYDFNADIPLKWGWQWNRQLIQHALLFTD